MNYFKYILAVSLFALPGCSKVIDKTSHSKLNSEELWNDESTASTYFNNLYTAIMPINPANASLGTFLPGNIHNTSDEMASPSSTTILYGQVTGETMTDIGNTSSVAYANVRAVNIVIRDIDGGKMSQDAKDRFKGQAYFFRAWIYFNLTKLYGGIPYIKTPQAFGDANLFVSRNRTAECFDNISSDLDSSVFYLNRGGAESALFTQSLSNYGRITRGAALALKGRALLHWASPQFNPNNEQSRWDAAYAANKAAYDQLIADGHALHTDFSQVLLDESNTNKERILVRSYDGNTTSATRYNSMENAARPVSMQGSGNSYQPTWDLVRAFLDTNGKKITESTIYNDTFYWMKRDPRFRATIVWNGSTWPLAGNTTRKQFIFVGNTVETSISQTGFYYRKGLSPATSNTLATYGVVDWVEIRLAEVMLNLAEAANYTNRQSEAADMIIALRKRAGIVAGTDNRYGLATGLSTSAMFDVIINERQTELAFENKRYDDLRRTKLFTTYLNGRKRQRITVVAVSDSLKNVLNTLISGTTYVRDTVNIWNINSARKFYSFTVSDIDNTPISFLPAYYFYGMPFESMKRNPQMYQTAGWSGGSGTFDPLQ